jgi:uncharacterized membrane protein
VTAFEVVGVALIGAGFIVNGLILVRICWAPKRRKNAVSTVSRPWGRRDSTAVEQYGSMAPVLFVAVPLQPIDFSPREPAPMWAKAPQRQIETEIEG